MSRCHTGVADNSFTGIYGKVFLDAQWMSQRRRAQVGFALFMIPSFVSFGWLCANQARFNNMTTRPSYDWNSPGWANAYVPFYIMQICGYLCQTVGLRDSIELTCSTSIGSYRASRWMFRVTPATEVSSAV